MAEKKRELTPLINSAIQRLINMNADAAKLEYYDNDMASRRLKKEIVDFEHGELKNLKDAVKDIRESINTKKQKTKNGTGTTTIQES